MITFAYCITVRIRLRAPRMVKWMQISFRSAS